MANNHQSGGMPSPMRREWGVRCGVDVVHTWSTFQGQEKSPTKSDIPKIVPEIAPNEFEIALRYSACPINSELRLRHHTRTATISPERNRAMLSPNPTPSCGAIVYSVLNNLQKTEYTKLTTRREGRANQQRTSTYYYVRENASKTRSIVVCEGECERQEDGDVNGTEGSAGSTRFGARGGEEAITHVTHAARI